MKKGTLMNLADITPQVMLNRLSELTAQRPDIETLSYILGPERVLEWLHSVGVATDHKLRDIAPQVPPYELRKIVAAPSESVFLWSGLKDAEMCAGCIEHFMQNEARDTINILDFGCGCGRTTRFLQANPHFKVHGADVNKTLVAWCQNNLKKVTSITNKVAPPLNFIEGQFDFIYSLSIFTHLPEASMLTWIDELARVTVDNGIVLLTSHGYMALEIISQSKEHQQMFQMSKDEAEEIRRTLAQKGFIYRKLSSDIIEAANAGADYGNSFTHENYIKERWVRDFFDVIEVVSGGLRGWQDVTILRRRVRK